MAFTTCNNIKFIESAESANPTYYYPNDIAILMNQVDAEAVTHMHGIFREKALVVMVAVKNITPEGVVEEDILNDAQNFAILPCPPFGGRGLEGGVFLPA